MVRWLSLDLTDAAISDPEEPRIMKRPTSQSHSLLNILRTEHTQKNMISVGVLHLYDYDSFDYHGSIDVVILVIYNDVMNGVNPYGSAVCVHVVRRC